MEFLLYSSIITGGKKGSAPTIQNHSLFQRNGWFNTWSLPYNPYIWGEEDFIFISLLELFELPQTRFLKVNAHDYLTPMFSSKSELMAFICSSWKKFHKGNPHTTGWHSASSSNLHSTWTGPQLTICRQGTATSGNTISCLGRQVQDSVCYNLLFVWWSFRLQHQEFSNFM